MDCADHAAGKLQQLLVRDFQCSFGRVAKVHASLLRPCLVRADASQLMIGGPPLRIMGEDEHPLPSFCAQRVEVGATIVRKARDGQFGQQRLTA